MDELPFRFSDDEDNFCHKLSTENEAAGGREKGHTGSGGHSKDRALAPMERHIRDVEEEAAFLKHVIQERDEIIATQNDAIARKEREHESLRNAVRQMGDTVEKIKRDREREVQAEKTFSTPAHPDFWGEEGNKYNTLGTKQERARDIEELSEGNPFAIRRPRSVPRGVSENTFFPDKYTGSTPLSDYLVHFEFCAKLNAWTDEEKAMYLAVSLRGPAQRLLSSVDKRKVENFECLVDVLEERFGTDGQSAIYMAELQNKHKGEKETFQELSDNVGKLVAKAYPSAPHDMIKILTLQHFIEAVPDRDLRTKLKMQKLKNVRDAVLFAIEYEAIENSEQQKSAARKPVREVKIEANSQQKSKDGKGSDGKNDIEAVTENLAKMISQLEQKLDKMATPKRKERVPIDQIQCYNCREMGHYASKCPQEDRRKKGTKDTTASKNE